MPWHLLGAVTLPSPQDLADAGGWAVAVFEALVILTLIVSGQLVPRRFYDREAARADKAMDQADRTTKVLARLTNAVKRIGGRIRPDPDGLGDDDDDDGT